MAVEQWRLAHPHRGMLEVLVGSSEELREFDPDFPETPLEQLEQEVEKDEAEGKAAEEAGEPAQLRAELEERAKAPGIKGKIAKILSEVSETHRVVVRQDDRVIARSRDLNNVKISLDKLSKDVEKGEFGYELTLSEPFLQLQKNFTGAYLVEVIVKTKGEIVKFDPPAGSRAATREKEMEESPTKRWLYPLLSGLGKGGWAFAVFILGPILSKVIDFIWSLIEPFIPDWEFPSIPWPHIDWPKIHLPSIPWPHIDWPQVNLPDWQIPDWLRPVLHAIGVAMDYSKIWMPIVIGLVVGILAVRRNKKSQSAKDKWGESAANQSTASESDGDPPVDR